MSDSAKRDLDTETARPTTRRPPPPRYRRRNRRGGVLTGLLIGGLVVGVLLVAAAALAQQLGHRFGHGHGDEPISAEALRARMDFAASWVYDQIEANESQRDAIDGLLDELVPDLVAYHEQGEALREAFHAALEAEDIDPAELERLQAELVDLVDRASRRGVEAIVQLDEVLTDAQREQLLALHR